MPKNNQIWPEFGILGHFGPGLAGSFGALLLGWLVVVARGLYLARHLFTLLYTDNIWEVKYHLIFFLLCVFSNAVGCIADDESELLWWQFRLKHNGFAHCRHYNGNIILHEFPCVVLYAPYLITITILWKIAFDTPLLKFRLCADLYVMIYVPLLF